MLLFIRVKVIKISGNKSAPETPSFASYELNFISKLTHQIFKVTDEKSSRQFVDMSGATYQDENKV